MIVFGDVAVVVSDAKASAQWWKEKCGFDVRDNEGHWVTVAAPGSPTIIHLCANGQHEQGNTGIGFWTDNAKRLEQEWAARGVKFSEPVGLNKWGSIAGRFLDPDGNEFQLLQVEKSDLAAASKAPTKATNKATTRRRKASAKKAPKKKAAKGRKKK